MSNRCEGEDNLMVNVLHWYSDDVSSVHISRLLRNCKLPPPLTEHDPHCSRCILECICLGTEISGSFKKFENDGCWLIGRDDLKSRRQLVIGTIFEGMDSVQIFV